MQTIGPYGALVVLLNKEAAESNMAIQLLMEGSPFWSINHTFHPQTRSTFSRG